MKVDLNFDRVRKDNVKKVKSKGRTSISITVVNLIELDNMRGYDGVVTFNDAITLLLKKFKEKNGEFLE